MTILVCCNKNQLPPPVRKMMNDGEVTDTQRQEVSPDEQPQAQPALTTTETLSQADVLVQAVRLLVEIAGPEPVHIEMADRGPKKYYEVKRAITAQDARAHLRG